MDSQQQQQQHGGDTAAAAAAAAAMIYDFVLAEITKIFYSRQWKALILVPKVTGSISFFASAFVARDIIVNYYKQTTDNNNNNNNINNKTTLPNRIVFLLSIADMMRSLFMDILGTWMAPTGVSYGSAGSIQSCTAQGFLVNFFGTSAYLYNTSLALCYVLMICYGFRGQKLASTVYLFLLCPALMALGVAIPPLFSDSYNYTGGWSCHIAPSPILCDSPNVPYPCDRGGIPNGRIALNLQLWTMIVPSFVCGIIILISMLVLFLETVKRNRASARYADYQRSQSNQGQSKRVAVQGVCYSLAYFLSVIFYYAIHVILVVNQNEDDKYSAPPYWLHMLNAIFLPLQGLFNAFVYLRPRRLRMLGYGNSSIIASGVRTTTTSLSPLSSHQLQSEELGVHCRRREDEEGGVEDGPPKSKSGGGIEKEEEEEEQEDCRQEDDDYENLEITNSGADTVNCTMTSQGDDEEGCVAVNSL